MGNFEIKGYTRGEQGKAPFTGAGEHNGKAGFKFTSFRIDYPLAARIDQIAQSEGLTFTTVVTRLLEKGVKDFGKIKKGVEPRFGPSEHARDDYSEKAEKPKKKKAKKEEEEAPKKKKAKVVEEAPAEKLKKKKLKKKVKAVAEDDEGTEAEEGDEPEIVDD